MTAQTTSPPRSGFAATLYPHAVILAEFDEIRLGDVLLDAATGPLVVNELVRRRQAPIAEFAEHRPARAWLKETQGTELRRVLRHTYCMLRVARDIEKFAPLSGHSTRVRSHNPRRQGCYVLNDGWRTECSCSWPGEQPQIHGGKDTARREWRKHKAAVISAAACDRHPGLALVTEVEQQHHLPPIPWEFAHNGVAVAHLDDLGHEQGVQVARSWAKALGVDVEDGRRDDVTTFHVEVRDDLGTVAIAINGFYEHSAEA